MNKFKNIIRKNILDNNKLSLILEEKCSRDIEESSLRMSNSLCNGVTIFFCGNGGSASDSQNFASELVGKFRNERKALRAIALTADSSILTNIANDFSGCKTVGIEHITKMNPDVILITKRGSRGYDNPQKLANSQIFKYTTVAKKKYFYT